MRFSLAALVLIGCAGAAAVPAPDADARFTPVYESFRPSPRTRPSVVLLEEAELRMTPAFKVVGGVCVNDPKHRNIAAAGQVQSFAQ